MTPEENGNTNTSHKVSSKLNREPAGGDENGARRNSGHSNKERIETRMYIITVFIKLKCRKDNEKYSIRRDSVKVSG